MPLRKLWNALCGRNPSGAKPSDSPIAPSGQPAANPIAGKTPAPRTSGVAAKPARGKPARGKPARGILRFGRGPHDPLCRAIRNSGATSVLEVSVGDGTRAVAVVGELSKANPLAKIRYAAVDQFELVGGDVSLLQFHRQLRKHGIHPQIYPRDIESGLVRVAHTIGAVDLVLISQPHPSQQAGEAQSLTQSQWARLIQRVTHGGSIVLRHDGEAWNRVDTAGNLSTGLSRAA